MAKFNLDFINQNREHNKLEAKSAKGGFPNVHNEPQKNDTDTQNEPQN